MSGLPWIKVWTAIGQHPKVQRLERELGIKDALGVVVRLWCWTADYCPSGDIPASDIDVGVKVARGESCRRPVQAMVDALVTAGLLDALPDGFRVHDWHELQTVHVEAEVKRKALAAERQSRYRERHSNASRNASRDGDVTHGSVTEKEKEREKETERESVSERSTVLPMPARSAGGSNFGPLGSELRQAVERGLGHGLVPCSQDQADELEKLVQGFGGVQPALDFVAATCRKRDTDPQSMAWVVTVLRPSASQGATP